MLEHRSRLCAHIDLRSRARSQFPMAGDKIRVQMSFENVANGRALFGGSLEVKLHIALRIDHDRLAPGSEQVRSVRQAPQVELFEVHREPHRTG